MRIEERNFCDNCELALPAGCGHYYGSQKQCPLGPRTDSVWIVGKAVLDDLRDRRGINYALGACDLGTQLEIIESIGKVALRATISQTDGRVADPKDAAQEREGSRE